MNTRRSPSTAARQQAVDFVHRLRDAGLVVPVGSTLAFLEALQALRATTRDAVYWAGRATLVVRAEDIPVFDAVFNRMWTARQHPQERAEQQTIAVDTGDGDRQDRQGDDSPPDVVLRFSAVESLRDKDFAHYDDDELRLAQAMMSRLRLAGPPRRSARLHTSRRGPSIDLRATMRSSLGAAGEPVRLHRRRPGQRLRRLVLLLDVSGSMEAYSRALVRFVHAAVAGRQRVEAFTFGTRLTRVTRELRGRDPDRAVADAAQRVADWSGGTRLGQSLATFNDQWGMRGMARGAIVVILSDGWDRGDPVELDRQLARLRRVTHRLIWVNPLKSSPGYAPLARGMAVALPYLDAFVEGHSISAMERLIAEIGCGQSVDTRKHRSSASHSRASHSGSHSGSSQAGSGQAGSGQAGSGR